MSVTWPQRILVVEDEPAIAESVAYALGRDGFSVTLAATATDAAALVDGADLVVLDLMLPDGSGFDLIARWRKNKHIPVIVLSSRDGEADRVVALEAGADDYVTKPFSPREVVARVRAVLRRSQMELGIGRGPPPSFHWMLRRVARAPMARTSSSRASNSTCCRACSSSPVECTAAAS